MKKDFSGLVATQGRRVEQQEQMALAVQRRAERAVLRAQQVRREARELGKFVQQATAKVGKPFSSSSSASFFSLSLKS